MSTEKKDKKGNVQLNFYCTLDEQQWVEHYRFRNHIPTKTEALRNIMLLGIEQMKLLEQQKIIGILSPDKALEDEKG